MDDKKRLAWILGSIVSVFVVLGIILCVLFNRIPGKYALVYFPNGEIYVGQLSTFPRLKLSQPYILQVTQDLSNTTGESSFQLIPLKESVWSTEILYLNKESYSYIAPLNDLSDVAQRMNTQTGSTQTQ